MTLHYACGCEACGLHTGIYPMPQHMQIITTALPKPPSSTTVMPHWLFIQGVQPRTDENTPVDRPVAKRARLQQQQALRQHRQVLPSSQQQQGEVHASQQINMRICCNVLQSRVCLGTCTLQCGVYYYKGRRSPPHALLGLYARHVCVHMAMHEHSVLVPVGTFLPGTW